MLAGEPVEAVAAEHLVRIFHREVLVAEEVSRGLCKHFEGSEH